MDTERKIFDQHASTLKTELLSNLDTIKSLNFEQATALLERVQNIRNQAENPVKAIDLVAWKEVFEIAERTILYLLAAFRKELLPEHAEVTKIANSSTNRVQLLEELKKQYPYAIRSTKEPHLYAVSLQQIESMYDPEGTSSRSYLEDWEHEVGHYANRLAVNKPIPKNAFTDFIAIIYRQGDVLGYRPAVFQDETNLSPRELLFVKSNGIDDLSSGDIRDIFQLIVIDPIEKIKKRIRSIFIKNKN